MLIFFHNIWKCIFLHRKITYRGYFYTSLKMTYLFDKHFVIFISDGSIILTFANININLCRENVSIINYANESSLHKYYNDFVLCWPEKSSPSFGLDAKFGNNSRSIPGYQISPITSYSYRRCFYFCGKKRETDKAFRRITQK